MAGLAPGWSEVAVFEVISSSPTHYLSVYSDGIGHGLLIQHEGLITFMPVFGISRRADNF